MDEKLSFRGEFGIEGATHKDTQVITEAIVKVVESLGLSVWGGFREVDPDVNNEEDELRCEIPGCSFAAEYQRSGKLLCYGHILQGEGKAEFITANYRKRLKELEDMKHG